MQGKCKLRELNNKNFKKIKESREKLHERRLIAYLKKRDR